jgi:hypothetical protein
MGLEVSELIANYWLKKHGDRNSLSHLWTLFSTSETENSSVLSDKGRFSGSAGQLFSAGLLNFVQTIQKSTH